MSFVWRKFSSVGGQGWYDEMKYGQKLKLGDAHGTPRNIQKVQASKLGDAPKHPRLHHQSIRSFFNALYFYCFICCVLFLERLYFCFQFYFVLLSLVYGWTHHICFGEDTLCFNCIEHSSFHSYCSTSVLFLRVLRLALVFHSYYVQSLLVFFS